jgi:hypothetical protein
VDLSDNEIGEFYDDLSSRQFERTPEGPAALADALKSSKSLQVLHAKSNGLRAAGAQAIGEMLKTNHTLTRLDLSDNEIGGWKEYDEDEEEEVFRATPEGPAALADGLKANQSVQVLQVFSNGFDADVGKLFLPIVDKPHFEVFSGIPIKQIRENSITELDLKGSKGKELEAYGGIILAHVLTGNTSLKVLDVSRNALGAAGAKAFSAMLKMNKTMKVSSLLSDRTCTNMRD